MFLNKIDTTCMWLSFTFKALIMWINSQFFMCIFIIWTHFIWNTSLVYIYFHDNKCKFIKCYYYRKEKWILDVIDFLNVLWPTKPYVLIGRRTTKYRIAFRKCSCILPRSAGSNPATFNFFICFLKNILYTV